MTTTGTKTFDYLLHENPGMGLLMTGAHGKNTLFVVTTYPQNDFYPLNTHQEIRNFGDNFRVINQVKIENQCISVNLRILYTRIKILKINPR